MSSRLYVVVGATVKNSDRTKDIELNYYFIGVRCFQPIPRKAIICEYMENGYLVLALEDGFSIEINTGPTAIAFNEIQFKHLTDPSLNFELPMGLVKRIYSPDLDNKINLRFR